MRRTFILIITSIIMYGLYIYTLPITDTVGSAAQAAAEARIATGITLPAVRLYAVSLGTYPAEELARTAAARYALRGAAATIVETEDGWALLGAGYASDGNASSVCSQLRSGEGINAQVILFSSEEVRISITATPGQSASIEAALEMLGALPDELNALSVQVDSGQCDVSTAHALVAIRYTEATRIRDALTAQLGDTADIFSRMVETLAIDTCASLEHMAAEDGPSGLALSSHMKQCALETGLGMINLMRSLR